MQNKNRISLHTTGFSSLLTIAFIVLKLIGVINWHWGWVLSPLWISAALTALLILIYCVTLKIWG